MDIPTPHDWLVGRMKTGNETKNPDDAGSMNLRFENRVGAGGLCIWNESQINLNKLYLLTIFVATNYLYEES